MNFLELPGNVILFITGTAIVLMLYFLGRSAQMREEIKNLEVELAKERRKETSLIRLEREKQEAILKNEIAEITGQSYGYSGPPTTPRPGRCTNKR